MPLCVVYFAYWAAFSAWNTALPHSDLRVWQQFFYKMLVGLVTTTVIWIACLVATVRERRLRRLGASV